MLDSLISLFANAKSVARCQRFTIGEFLDGVRLGEWRREVARVRELTRAYSTAAREHGSDSDQTKVAKSSLDSAKEGLPGATLAGYFDDRRKGAQPRSMNGMVAVDLDGLQDLDEARRRLTTSPHVLACWLSCSGRGLWVLVRVTPALTAAEYGAAWGVVANHVAGLLGIAPDAIGASGKPILDQSVKNVSRLCFVSHDPSLWTNPKAQPLGTSTMGRCHEEEEGESSSEHSISEPAAADCTLRTALGSEDAVLAQMDADIRGRERLELLPPLVRNAYTRHFDRRFVLAPGTRNATVANAAPALVRRLSFDVALAVLMAFYDLHRELWHDSRERHEEQSIAALTNELTRLIGTLSDKERAIYERLRTETRKAALRIARDLARTNDRGEKNAFFLSECELAGRIGVSDITAREILQDFVRWGILTLLERGERRTLGKKRRASRWKWNLSVEP